MPPELDLVETDDQITHELTLEDPLETKVGWGRVRIVVGCGWCALCVCICGCLGLWRGEGIPIQCWRSTPAPVLPLRTAATQIALDVFKEDPEYEQHEAEYAAIKREILGEDVEEEGGEEASEGEEGDEESSEEEEESEDEEKQGEARKGRLLVLLVPVLCCSLPVAPRPPHICSLLRLCVCVVRSVVLECRGGAAHPGRDADQPGQPAAHDLPHHHVGPRL